MVAALPADAKVIFRRDSEPSWGSCGGKPGSWAWTAVDLQLSFSTGAQAADVLTHADEALKSAGWQRQFAEGSPSQPTGHWTKALADGRPAHVYLRKDGIGQNRWTLNALAAPVGPTAKWTC